MNMSLSAIRRFAHIAPFTSHSCTLCIPHLLRYWKYLSIVKPSPRDPISQVKLAELVDEAASTGVYMSLMGSRGGPNSDGASGY